MDSIQQKNVILRKKLKLIGKLESNDTSKNGMIPSASKDVSIKFVYKCIHIINNKEI